MGLDDAAVAPLLLCAFGLPGQASVSVAVIFISYILHQRYQPFLVAKAFSDFAMTPAASSKPQTPRACMHALLVLPPENQRKPRPPHAYCPTPH